MEILTTWFRYIPLWTALFLQACGGGLGDDSLQDVGIFYGTDQNGTVILLLHDGEFFLASGMVAAKGAYTVNGVDLAAAGEAYDMVNGGSYVGTVSLAGSYKTNRHILLNWSVNETGATGQAVVEGSGIYAEAWSLDDLRGGWINQDESNITFLTMTAPVAEGRLQPEGGNNDLLIAPVSTTEDYAGVTVEVVGGVIQGAEFAEYNEVLRKLTVRVDLSNETPSTANDVVTAVNDEGRFTAALDATETDNDGSGAMTAISTTLELPVAEDRLSIEGAILSSLTQIQGSVGDASPGNSAFEVELTISGVGSGDPAPHTGFAVISETEIEGEIRPEMLIMSANGESVFMNQLFWVSEEELQQDQEVAP